MAGSGGAREWLRVAAVVALFGAIGAAADVHASPGTPNPRAEVLAPCSPGSILITVATDETTKVSFVAGSYTSTPIWFRNTAGPCALFGGTPYVQPVAGAALRPVGSGAPEPLVVMGGVDLYHEGVAVSALLVDAVQARDVGRCRPEQASGILVAVPATHLEPTYVAFQGSSSAILAAICSGSSIGNVGAEFLRPAPQPQVPGLT